MSGDPLAYAPGVNVADQLRRALSHYVPAARLELAVQDALSIAVGIGEARYQTGRREADEELDRIRSRLTQTAIVLDRVTRERDSHRAALEQIAAWPGQPGIRGVDIRVLRDVARRALEAPF